MLTNEQYEYAVRVVARSAGENRESDPMWKDFLKVREAYHVLIHNGVDPDIAQVRARAEWLGDYIWECLDRQTDYPKFLE